MINRVMFVSRTAAENAAGMSDWAVVSISEDAEAKLLDGWYAVHRSYFHDVDPGSPCGEPHVLMNATHATDIVAFVESVAPHVTGVLVHCKAGISRSAAVAKWIAERFDLPFNHSCSIYNRNVYRLLCDATAGDKQ